MTKKLFIEGMSCGHCVAHVEEALKEVDGVKSILVNLEEKTAVIELTQNIDDGKLEQAINQAGYKLVNIQ